MITDFLSKGLEAGILARRLEADILAKELYAKLHRGEDLDWHEG